MGKEGSTEAPLLQLHYFGKCADDPKGKAALSLWLDQKDDLLAGREPRENRQGNGLTVDELVQRFLHSKKTRYDSGELQFSTWNGYRIKARQILKHFERNRVVEDIRPADFTEYRAELSKKNGLVGMKNSPKTQ